VQLGGGSQHAEVKGFLAPASGGFPWAVLAPTVGYRLTFAEMLSGFARIGPVVQLWPQSFSVKVSDDADTTSEVAAAPSVGVVLELGLALGRDVF